MSEQATRNPLRWDARDVEAAWAHAPRWDPVLDKTRTSAARYHDFCDTLAGELKSTEVDGLYTSGLGRAPTPEDATARDCCIVEARAWRLPFLSTPTPPGDQDPEATTGHPSDHRFLLVQVRLKVEGPAVKRGATPGDPYDIVTYLILDHRYLGAEQPRAGKAHESLILLDQTHMPLHDLLDREGVVLDFDIDAAERSRRVECYLDFYTTVVSGTVGWFHLIKSRDDLKGTLDRARLTSVQRRKYPDLLHNEESIRDQAYLDLLGDTEIGFGVPLDEIDRCPQDGYDAARVEIRYVREVPKLLPDGTTSWTKNAESGYIYECTAYIGLHDRIYRAGITIRDSDGLVDFETLDLVGSHLPMVKGRRRPTDGEPATDEDGRRIGFVHEASPDLLYEPLTWRRTPPGWTDAARVTADEFLAAALDKSGRGLDMLYRAAKTFGAVGTRLPHERDNFHLRLDVTAGEGGGLVGLSGEVETLAMIDLSDAGDPEASDRRRDPEGVRMAPEDRAFHVIGPVSGSGLDFDAPLSVRAYFEDDVRFEGASFGHAVDFSRCVFRRSLLLSNSSIEGALDLNGVSIAGGTAYRRTRPRLALDHMHIKGPWSARGLVIGKPSWLAIRRNQRTVDAAPVRPISARSTVIEGEVDLRGLKAGGLDLDSARIRGNFTLSSDQVQASVREPGQQRRDDPRPRLSDAIASVSNMKLDFADVDGNVTLNGLQAHRISMKSGRFRGNLYFEPVKWRILPGQDAGPPPADAPTTSPLSDTEEIRYLPAHILVCLDLDFCQLDGIVHARGLQMGFRQRTESIRELLDECGSDDGKIYSDNPNTTVPRAHLWGSYLKAAELRLSGYPLDRDYQARGRTREFENGRLDQRKLVRTRINGMARFRGSEIGGPIDVDGALISDHLDVSLSRIGGLVSAVPMGPYVTEILGDLDFTNSHVGGVAELYGIWIGRSLRMMDASFEEFFMRTACVRSSEKTKHGSPVFGIRNPNIGYQFNADNVSVRGIMNLTGIQIGFRPAFYERLPDGDRDEDLGVFNLRYSTVKGPVIFWQGATLRRSIKTLTDLYDKYFYDAPPDAVFDAATPRRVRPVPRDDIKAYALATVRARIFGDMRMNHSDVGAGICMINMLCVGQVSVNDAKIGGDIMCRWPLKERDWPPSPHMFELGAETSDDHDWSKKLAQCRLQPENIEKFDDAALYRFRDARKQATLALAACEAALKRHYNEKPDDLSKRTLVSEGKSAAREDLEKCGLFQCCQFSMELVRCQGGGFFSGLEILDIDIPYTGGVEGFDQAAWEKKKREKFKSPDFLGRQAHFDGRIQFIPRKKEEEVIPDRDGQGTRPYAHGHKLEHDWCATVPGRLDLSSVHASLLIMSSHSFKSTLLDYPDIIRFLQKHTRGNRELADFIATAPPAILQQVGRRDSETGSQAISGHFVTHFASRVSEPLTAHGTLDMDELRRLELEFFGINLERAEIAHLEIHPDIIPPETDYTHALPVRSRSSKSIDVAKRFPRVINLHGLKVQRWDVQPDYFEALLDAQPTYEQSTYIMMQRELRDQGFEKASRDIYFKMRKEQSRYKKEWSTWLFDQMERVLFRYSTTPMTRALFLILVGWFLVSWLVVFSDPYNISVRPDSIVNTQMAGEAQPPRRYGRRPDGNAPPTGQVALPERLISPEDLRAEGMRWIHGPNEAELLDLYGKWSVWDSMAIALYYHAPFLDLKRGEKWLASDTRSLNVERIIGFYGLKRLDCIRKRSQVWCMKNKPDLFGRTLNRYRYDDSGLWSGFTAEDYGNITSIFHWFFYAVILAAAGVTIVQNRAASLGGGRP